MNTATAVAHRARRPLNQKVDNMRDVYVIGVGMTPFGKHWSRTVRSLATTAAEEAIRDAGLTPNEIPYVYFSNAVGGLVSGQETIRGQVALRHTGLLGATIINVENACASGSSAAHLAWMTVASGQAETAMVVGAEKLTHSDKAVSFRAYASGVDLDEIGGEDHTVDRLAVAVGTGNRSRFMDIYAESARAYMEKTGATQADLAAVVVKSRQFASRNARAQLQEVLTIEQVQGSREIVWPLTLPMCSPIGDGAASVILGSKEVALAAGGPLVRVRASVLTSGTDNAPLSVERAVDRVYDESGIGPADLDVVELHDAAAPAELEHYESLRLAPEGDAAALIRSGQTALGGTTYVNPSGGLLAKGHPVGASGCAQLVELTEQLKGRSGDRQHPDARLALAHNAGGSIGADTAALSLTVLERI
ncbi:thiolase family protein [Rhodococcus sp. T2V]|uniref:thiolase family protein n=1 Tax=Rhodococcus sp. T2V TaxID=3034164 RepID=UPI0023E15DA0|nr:thiolase family protein [Rhodococcus sp. T2V]MDF3312052.1 thiolase family protein [Rhodococcus sp. T2V]